MYNEDIQWIYPNAIKKYNFKETIDMMGKFYTLFSNWKVLVTLEVKMLHIWISTTNVFKDDL
jgi:hypothetical protein